jgi:hypothetical protein
MLAFCASNINGLGNLPNKHSVPYLTKVQTPNRSNDDFPVFDFPNKWRSNSQKKLSSRSIPT